MFERYQSGENAILVHVDFPEQSNQEDLNEFIELVRSAQIGILQVVTLSLHTPVPKYFIGKGKVEEISALVKSHQADVILFNHTLSPSQERNLEQVLQCRVVDRTGLILDIFAQRAQSHEGKLQVELAQLRHLSTRLVRGWTHLERQKGGIGLRGPGETQLETDRRLLRARIKTIDHRLQKVEKQRAQSRRSRQRANLASVSLVGYTNAGKSTLFNRLTQSNVLAADQLFATLDPTHRRLSLSEHLSIILADTVGFIRHLPHDLVAAFKATLQEGREADVLLHVIDASDERREQNKEQVYEVLDEIGAGNVTVMEVYNKIDAIEELLPKSDICPETGRHRVWCSAKSGEGLSLLNDMIIQAVAGVWKQVTLKLPVTEMSLRGQLYNLNSVLNENITEEGDFLLDIKLQLSDWKRLQRKNDDVLSSFVYLE